MRGQLAPFFYCFLCMIALNGPLTIERSADQLLIHYQALIN